MQFEPGEREYLREMRLLTTDINGNVVFVGLTVYESEEYFAHTRPGNDECRQGESWEARDARRARYLELHWKMERAKFDAIATEHVVRTMKPTVN